MTDQHREDSLTLLLREALPPVEDPRLEADLWDLMQHRLTEVGPRVTTIDWVLLTVAAGLVVTAPEALLLVLYYL